MFASPFANTRVSFIGLAVDGSSDSALTRAFVVGDRTLVYRCRATGSFEAVHIYNRDQIVVAENEFWELGKGSGQGIGTWVSGEHVALLGNRYHDVTAGEHVVRMQPVRYGVVAHNTLTLPSSGRHALTIRGNSKRFAVIGNHIGEAHLWAMYFGPANAQSPGEVVEWGIVEGNLIAGELHPVHLSGPRLTLRNNALVTDASSCIGVGRKCSACVAPGALWLFHNSCFSSSDGGSAAVRLLKIESSSDTRVLNNVLVAPNSGSHEAIDGTVAEAADNLATAEQLFAGQPITGGPQLDQLKLAAGASAAIDRATPLESVLYDLFGALRAGAPDIGAHER